MEMERAKGVVRCAYFPEMTPLSTVRLGVSRPPHNRLQSELAMLFWGRLWVSNGGAMYNGRLFSSFDMENLGAVLSFNLKQSIHFAWWSSFDHQ